jgi:ribonuclease HI
MTTVICNRCNTRSLVCECRLAVYLENHASLLVCITCAVELQKSAAGPEMPLIEYYSLTPSPIGGEGGCHPRGDLVLYICGNTEFASASIGIFHREGSTFNASEKWPSGELGRPTTETSVVLYAAVRALEMCSAPSANVEPEHYSKIVVMTECQPLVASVKYMLDKWRLQNWKLTPDNESSPPIPDYVLWKRLDTARAATKVPIRWELCGIDKTSIPSPPPPPPGKRRRLYHDVDDAK